MTARARTLATIFIGLALFAASLPAFYPQVFGTRISDIPAHFSIGSTDAYARYSILYLLVHGLLSIGANEPVMGWVAIVLLSTFVAFKAALNFRVLSEESKGLILPTCVAVVLTFAMPIMNWWNYHSVYLGQIAPTVWHNSTTILEMPVAILLFYAGLRCLEESNFRNSVLVSGLAALSTLIKPSYAIAWLPVFVSWFCLKAYGGKGMSMRRLAGQVAVLVGPIAVLLMIQGLLIETYITTRIIFAPFGVWSLYSPHPAFSLLLSLAFPLSALILCREPLRQGRGLAFAWLVFAVALLQFILFAEDGARFSHGNFFWGAFMALHVLFLTSADLLLRQPISMRSLTPFGFLVLHFASGLYFYGRIVSGLGYM